MQTDLTCLAVTHEELYEVEGGMGVLGIPLVATVVEKIATTIVNTVNIVGNGNTVIIINGGCGR